MAGAGEPNPYSSATALPSPFLSRRLEGVQRVPWAKPNPRHSLHKALRPVTNADTEAIGNPPFLFRRDHHRSLSQSCSSLP